MERSEFYNVHKDFAQDGQAGPIFGHEEFHGMEYDAAMAKYHTLLASAYGHSDPWTHVFVTNDMGVTVEHKLIDRRTVPAPEVPEEGGNAE